MDPLQNQNSNPAPAPVPAPEPVSQPAPTQAPVSPVSNPVPTPAPAQVPPAPAPAPTPVVPPTSAPTYVPAVETSSHKELRLILPAMLVLLLLAGGYALYRNMTGTPDTAFVPAANTNSNTTAAGPVVEPDGVTASTTPDIAAAQINVPQGWPAWIPVERGSLKDSSKVYYESESTVLYSVSYTSTKSLGDIWNLMSAASTKEGFALDKDANKTNGVYIAKNAAGDTLMAVISKQDSETLVQVSFLDK